MSCGLFSVGLVEKLPSGPIAQLVELRTFKPWLTEGEKGPCKPWTGKLSSYGYPTNREHRKVLAAKLGRPIAPGMEAMHDCDNPACVNPDHISEGTHRQNIADRDARGRTQRGERHWKAILNAESVIAIRGRAGGESLTSIAASFGVAREVISKIVRGITWKHVVPRTVSP